VFGFAGSRWLLTHGDALCLSDEGYMRFRSEVRAPEWQRAFLARPLAQRKEIARGLREQSEAAQRAALAYATSMPIPRSRGSMPPTRK
jgi:UDP-2,3-diacylglucosamine hydrolase